MKPDALRDPTRWTRINVPGMKGARVYRRRTYDGSLRAIVAHEPVGPQGQLRWHASVSFSGTIPRLPTWEELSHARYHLVPDEVTMAMLLPPVAEFINLHTGVLHIFELEDQ